jgi:hypothetical protein
VRQGNHGKELLSGHDVPLPLPLNHDGGGGAGLDYIEGHSSHGRRHGMFGMHVQEGWRDTPPANHKETVQIER